jgi:hypothetical protein
MAPSFRAFIPVPSIHGTNSGKPQHMALINSASNTQGPDNVPLYAPPGASLRIAPPSDYEANAILALLFRSRILVVGIL